MSLLQFLDLSFLILSNSAQLHDAISSISGLCFSIHIAAISNSFGA